eukprot:TRINITY_DN30765_c0_g1_i1.p1 TRINITY_DN30765_c0_g1~~TRINITY_DN30765_c0_g1_i1.p1  ORF type:complete len:513 (-),score=132.20 TRINITY_DN30765_c0_g1_i1:210-1748(-)
MPLVGQQAVEMKKSQRARLRAVERGSGFDWLGSTSTGVLRLLMVCLLTSIFSINMVSLTIAKNGAASSKTSTSARKKPSGFQFEYVTVTLLQETSKLAVACWFYQRHSVHSSAEKKGLLSETYRSLWHSPDFLLYSIPGLLYCVDTNFQYIILGFLEPAELAIIWNFKVVATALLLRVVLGVRYSWGQWMALLVLVLGCAMTQAGDIRFVHGLPRSDSVAAVSHQRVSHDSAVNDDDDAAGIANATVNVTVTTTTGPLPTAPPLPSKMVGAGLAIIGSSIAASSNVFCEWLVKMRPEESIHFQNMQLYVFGVGMNAAALLLKTFSDPASPVHREGGFFAGYTGWVWAVVLLGATSGMMISFTLKFVDNIAVVFAHALAVLIASGLSSGLLGIDLSPAFVCGGLLVAAALTLFHLAESKHVELGAGNSKSDEADPSGPRELTQATDLAEPCWSGQSAGYGSAQSAGTSAGGSLGGSILGRRSSLGGRSGFDSDEAAHGGDSADVPLHDLGETR